MIKGILKACLPTIIVPAIFVSIVVHFFGITVDSLLALIFFGQFYIIWAQLEVAMRQTRFSSLEYDPEFKIETKKISYQLVGGGYRPIKLINTGKHLAQNVLISVNLTRKPNLQERVHSQQVSNIAPDEMVDIYPLDEGDFLTAKITIKLDYKNILGDFDGMTFVKEPKFQDFIVFRSERRMPGILLNSFEDLISSLRLLTLPRRVKKIKKERENKK